MRGSGRPSFRRRLEPDDLQNTMRDLKRPVACLRLVSRKHGFKSFCEVEYFIGFDQDSLESMVLKMANNGIV